MTGKPWKDALAGAAGLAVTLVLFLEPARGAETSGAHAARPPAVPARHPAATIKP